MDPALFCYIICHIYVIYMCKICKSAGRVYYSHIGHILHIYAPPTLLMMVLRKSILSRYRFADERERENEIESEGTRAVTVTKVFSWLLDHP